MQTALSLAIEQFGQRLPMDFIGNQGAYGGGPGPMVPDPNNPFLAGQGAGAGTNPLGQVNYAGPANANFYDPTIRGPITPGAQGNNIGQIGGTFASNVFTPFDFNNDVLSDVQEEVTRGLFSGNTGSLTNMFTSSLLTATQKTYYQEIHSNGDPALTNDAVSELSMAYGHFGGSGSRDLTGNLNNDTPTRGIYSQYAQLLLDPGDRKFTFDGTNSDSIYVLNFNRARFRERIDAGNFELTLARLSASLGTAFANNANTGSNVKLAGDSRYIQIVDDSQANSPTVGQFGPIYNLVSGTLDNATQGQVIHNPTDPVHYGLLYPHLGVAVLNAEKLDLDLSAGGVNFGSVTGSQVQGDNAMKLFRSLSGSNNLTPVNFNGGIQARSMERVKASYYFCRVRNATYNYSNNKSFTSGSGELAYASFADNPQVYITTVGMYNNNRELLAVAKLSQPILKNFTREALIKVKLNF
jgi:hypothetical protein